MHARRTLTTATMAAALAIGPAFAGTALAQSEEQEQQIEQSREQIREGVRREAEREMERSGEQLQATAGLTKASEVTGKPVVDAQGNEVGTLHDTAVDLTNGRVAYGIIADADLASGNELAAVPAQLLRWEPEQITLTISQDELRQAEGFNRGDEPDMTDAQWAQQTFAQFGLQPYWEAGAQQPGQEQQQQPGQQQQEEQSGQQQEQQQQQFGEGQMGEQPGQFGQGPGQAQAQDQEPTEVLLFEQLKGQTVRNLEDEEIGEVSDLVIDAREGRVAYGIVSHGGFLGMGRKHTAAPWRALQYEPDQEQFVLDADQETIERVSYAAGEEPDWTDEQWAAETHQAFNQPPYWQVYGYAPPGSQTRVEAGAIATVLQRGMEDLGVPSDAARQKAEELAREYEQQQLQQQELASRIQTALEEAGVDPAQAEQAGQDLSQRILEQGQQGQQGMGPGAAGAAGAAEGAADTEAVTQQLQQGMEEAGVDPETAQTAAEQIAEQHAQQQFAQQELASRIQQRLEEAGVEASQAEQAAQDLATRIVERAQQGQGQPAGEQGY